MLEIKPVSDKEEQNEICKKCGMEHIEGYFVYKALESGQLLACAEFDIEGKEAVIIGMSQVIGTEPDNEAMFILGRAVLNFLDLCGVETVRYEVKTETDRAFSVMIGFKKDESGEMRICLTGLFTSKCKNENKE